MTKRQDWLLLALDHRQGKSITPVQIQKAMFVMAMEAKKEVGKRFYKFEPYNYGPFDVTIYRDLEDLAGEGLVSVETSPHRWSIYSITPAGIQKTSEIKKSTDADTVDYLREVVDWVCGRSFSSLVRAIYHHYPQYKVNSVFIG